MSESCRNCEEDCHPCDCCENYLVCRWAGPKGTQWASENRFQVIGFAMFTNFVATILAIVALCAISKNTGTVKNTSWSHGSFENYGNVTDGDIYVGLSNVVVCKDGDCGGIPWSTAECDLYGGDACQECKDAATGSIWLAVPALITQIPTFQTNKARLYLETDSQLQKGLGLVTNLLQFFSFMGTAITFATACYNNLTGGKVDYEFGPGFICVLMVLWIKPLNAFLHFLVPAPRRMDKLIDDDEIRGYRATKNGEAELSENGGVDL